MGTHSITTDTDITDVANKTGLRAGCTYQRYGTVGTITDSNHNLVLGDLFYIKENSQANIAATWTRIGTTATVTSIGHNLVYPGQIRVSASSATATIPLGTKTLLSVGATTFTFTCVNTGATSGTLSYDNNWIDESAYAVTIVGTGIVAGVTWARTAGSTTITVTSAGHGMVGAGNTIYLVFSSDLETTPLGAETITYINANSFSFVGVNTGATSGTLDYIRTNNFLSAPSTFVATALNSGTNYTGTLSYTSPDNFNISNGATLTIDTDLRYGLNQSTYTSLGAVTMTGINPRLLIDGRSVRLIPYDTGSGNLPVLDSTVTQGSASGKLIGVWGTLTTSPTTTGAIPASGYIKIRDWNGVAFSSGALTLSGITANATGADIVGWIDVNSSGGSKTVIAGSDTSRFESLGDWYSLGTTDGAAGGQAFQLPTSGSLMYCPGIFVETGVGTGVYEPYPNMAATAATAAGTEAERGKVCWTNASGTGEVRIGQNNAGTSTGYVPASGLKVVIGNVFLTNGLPETPTNNIVTISSRKNLNTFSGKLVIEKVMGQWDWTTAALTHSWSITYASLQANVVVQNHLNFLMEKSCISDCVASTTLSTLYFNNSISGVAQIIDCKLLQNNPASYYPVVAGTSRSNRIEFTRCWLAAAIHDNNGIAAYVGNIAASFIFNDCVFIAARSFAAGNTTPNSYQCEFYDCKYINRISGSSAVGSSLDHFCYSISMGNLIIDNLTYPIATAGLYDSVVSMTTTGGNTYRIINNGTALAPLKPDTSTADYFFGATAQWGIVAYIARCHVRTDIATIYFAGTGSLSGTIQNVYDDYAANFLSTATFNGLDLILRGVAGTISLTPMARCSGFHFCDNYTSTTAGRINLLMHPPSLNTLSYVTKSTEAFFDSSGGLYLQNVDDYCIWEMPYYTIGHTGFANSDPTMGGGTASNYSIEYQIDTNNGTGFSSWDTMSGANLSAETVDAIKGFKLKVKITTTTGNTDAITSLYAVTTSTTTTQAYLYPLDDGSPTPENIWTTVPIDNPYTGAQLLRGIAAAVAGKKSITPGSPNEATVTFRDINDTVNRIVADMSYSDRTAVALDLVETEASGTGTTAQEVWDYPIEGTYTAADLLKIIASYTLGKSEIVVGVSPELATMTFRDVNDTVDRIVGDVDSSERTTVEIDV